MAKITRSKLYIVAALAALTVLATTSGSKVRAEPNLPIFYTTGIASFLAGSRTDAVFSLAWEGLDGLNQNQRDQYCVDNPTKVNYRWFRGIGVTFEQGYNHIMYDIRTS